MLKRIFDRPIAVVGIFLVLLIVGYILATRIEVALLPDMSYPGLSIKAQYPGEAPRRIEDRLTIPIERAVNGLSGVRSVTATAGRGESSVTINFEYGVSMREKLLEVQERLKRIEPQFPEGMTDIRVSRFDSRSMPTFIGSFFSEGLSRQEIRDRLENRLKPKLQRLEAVASVEVVGGRDRKFLVDLQASRLSALEVRPSEVSSVLSTIGSPISLGTVNWRNREVSLRLRDFTPRARTLARLPVAIRGPGQAISLDQVANVRSDFLPRRGLTRINGEASIGLYVHKTSQANLLDASAAIRSVLEDVQMTNVNRRIVLDQAQPVREALASLRNAVVVGALAALLVLFFFLGRLSYVLIVSAVLPVSVFFVIIVLYLLDLSLNIVTLSGIALGVGMLVDTSVVILHNVLRKRRGGTKPDRSLTEGTREMILPLLASVLTTIVVFLPLVFVPSRVQQLYSGLAVTVTAALVGSLLVSFLLVPVLLNYTDLGASAEFEVLSTFHRSILDGLIQSRGIFLICFCVVLVLSCSVFFLVNQSLSLPFQQRNLSLSVEVEPGTPLRQSRRLLGRLESVLDGAGFVESYSTHFEDWNGTVNVQLKPFSEDPTSTTRARNRLRSDFETLRREGLKIFFEQGQGEGGRRLRVELVGPEIPRLYEFGQRLRERLGRLGYLKNLHIVLPRPIPAYRLQLNRKQLAQYGMTPREFFATVRSRLAGRVVTRLMEERGEREVILRGNPSDVKRISDLESMSLMNRNGPPVDVTSVVTVEERAIGSSIQRKDGERTGFLVGRLTGDVSLMAAYRDVLEISREMSLPDAYRFRMGDKFEDLQTIESSLYWLIVTTLGLIYLILMGTLESLWKPVLVMLAVPVSVIGSVWSLYLFSYSMTISSYIGLLILMGLVVNSSVVLVNRMANLEGEGSLETTVVAAAVERLQPVLMTSLTTILALFPLLFVTQAGSTLSAPLALVVIGGLAVGVGFNLLVLPVLYLVIASASINGSVGGMP